MEVGGAGVGIDGQRLLELGLRGRPISLLRQERAESVVQRHCIGRARLSVGYGLLQARHSSLSIVCRCERADIADYRDRRQRFSRVAIERVEDGERLLVGLRLFVSDGEVYRGDAIVGLHCLSAFELWHRERRLTELQQHGTKRAVTLGNLRRELHYFLEVFAGGGEVATLDCGVAGMKSRVGLVKLLLLVRLLGRRRLRPCDLHYEKDQQNEPASPTLAIGGHRYRAGGQQRISILSCIDLISAV